MRMHAAAAGDAGSRSGCACAGRLLESARGAYLRVRRAQDVVLSLLALIILTIPMLLVALVIVIDSPGASPIFVQERVGRNGKPFRFFNLWWMEKQYMLHIEIDCIQTIICAT